MKFGHSEAGVLEKSTPQGLVKERQVFLILQLDHEDTESDPVSFLE